jgi:ABC-type cobalamin/Fe3+-siderophores transport system ATPase subunit
MVPFTRKASLRWHDEVPGARWFKVDLHLHTLDDHPSGNLQRPTGLVGDASDPVVQTAYARAFLQSAIANGVEVLGLTPHSVKSGNSDDTSVTWRIVEVWNSDKDDDGVAFRDKIYAVFPGFEPNLADGSEGLHLLFLFDPEIQREHYLAAFASVMGAVPPWNAGSLTISSNDAKTAFESLKKLRERLTGDWSYICLAAHAFSARGLFSLKSEILQHHFPHECIRGLELKDSWLPEDAYLDKPWLKDGMKEHRHSFFHASDAYSPTEIGKRLTLMKLSSPRVESLRQAFLAPDSRIRIAYRKDAAGNLMVRDDLPDSATANRPWMRRISVTGGTSFFGGLMPSSGLGRTEAFDFNPDLTCIIGGRMSGKSTLLDGIRVFCGLALPDDLQIRADVESKASERFLSGNAAVTAEIRGPINPELSLRERWPAVFFSQRELQKAVNDHGVRRQVLYKLVSSEASGLIQRAEEINKLDQELWALSAECDALRQGLEDAEEAFDLAKRSKDALDRFSSAGVNKLTEAQSDLGKIEALNDVLEELRISLGGLERNLTLVKIPDLASSDAKEILEGESENTSLNRIANRLRASARYFSILAHRAERIVQASLDSASVHIATVTTEVQTALVSAGGSAEELNKFDALTKTAADFESRHTHLQQAKAEYRGGLFALGRKRRRRSLLIRNQRDAMARVAAAVSAQFGARIRIVEKLDDDPGTLEHWLLDFREVGVTRWWNAQKIGALTTTTPSLIRKALSTSDCTLIAMSAQVFSSFSSAITSKRRLELFSLRNTDDYSIELRVSEVPLIYREMDDLSGGAQASVLLSLVLQTDDSQPLIIDQPEDELDKDYLLDIFLPALRKLKGRRQIVFATHDANIVVNGDADQVIYLTADHQSGHVNEEGTIDKEDVRDAILNTLDGGADAFSLRQTKYGF